MKALPIKTKVLICNNCKLFWFAPLDQCSCGGKTLTETHIMNGTYAQNKRVSPSNKRIGGYIRDMIRPKARKPKIMSKVNEYDMVLGDDGFYETTFPSTLVPKIGVKKPNKIKYTYAQLRNLGYNPKSK